jgi:lipopolysaccharide/colanic/teichoic acid biosynthesis glycosyltransferase
VICRLPSSRARLRLRLSPVDVALAAVSPFAALYLRNGDVASNGDWISAGSYCFLSLAFSLLAFQVCGISNIIVRYISVSDLLDIAKVVLAGELMTATVLFTVTRLEGIPRSVPAIHALILGAGLIAYRGLVNLGGKQGRHTDQMRRATKENVILIGLNDWSVLLMKYLQAQAPKRRRVIALLDEEPRWIGRSVNGVHILGPPGYLEAAIEEFAMHGLRTDRIIVGGEPSELSGEALAEVRDICAQRDLDIVFVPGLSAVGSMEHNCCSAYSDPGPLPSSDHLPSIRPAPHFRFKRLIDVTISLILILTLLPLLVVTALIVLFDVGWPVLFWQQRTGQGGRELQLYKLRTLRPPFDRRGQRISEEQRLSGIGPLLRYSRFDELPQLLNVLVGDMSLIGPRPLLPQDQPPNSALRLTVRPGITGWAQVNGGTLLSATEKDALDVWYIRNASLWLDLRITWMTFFGLVKSDRRGEEALAQAMHSHRQERGSNQAVASWFATVDARHLDDAGQHSPVQSADAAATVLPGSSRRGRRPEGELLPHGSTTRRAARR